MKTKKLLCGLMVAMCAIGLSGLMTNCNKHQNDPDVPDDPQVKKAAFARAEADITVTNDMLEVLDLTLSYYDNAGELKQKAVTTSEIKLETKAPLPTRAGLCLTAQLKEGIDIESYDQVDLTCIFSYKCAAVDEDDIIVGQVHRMDGDRNSMQLKGAHVPAWVTTFNKVHPIKFLYEFDAEGNSQKAEWE